MLFIKPLQELRELARYKELLRNLVARDVKVRYKRSLLGFLWMFLNPLLIMLILSMIFSEVFKSATENYVAYLISGIVMWNFFSQSTSSSMMSFMYNRNLIKKIYVPKAVFPLSTVLSATVNFAFSMAPLLVIFIATGTPVSRNLYLLPVIIAMLALLAFGIALFLSTLTVFFQDTVHIYQVFLTALMFMTPIFYPASIVSPDFSLMLDLNPLYHYLTAFRQVLYADAPDLFERLLVCAAFSFLAFAAGWLFYDRYKDRIVYHL